MAENKTQETNQNVEAFLDGITHEKRRADALTLLKLMKRLTREKPKMWGDSIVGFGKYHYRYDSGREGDWFRVGFSPRKQYMSIYLMCDHSPLSAIMNRLGKYKTGKGCLYINKLEDVDQEVLVELIEAAYRQSRKENA